MAATWTVITTNHADNHVTAIYWAVTDDGGDYIGEVREKFVIPPGHAATSVPYDNVTEAQCIAWVKADLGGEVSTYEKEATRRRKEQRTPRDNYVPQNRGEPWE